MTPDIHACSHFQSVNFTWKPASMCVNEQLKDGTQSDKHDSITPRAMRFARSCSHGTFMYMYASYGIPRRPKKIKYICNQLLVCNRCYRHLCGKKDRADDTDQPAQKRSVADRERTGLG